MRYAGTLAFIALGFMLGWLVCGVWPGLQTMPPGNILTAATTLAVAIWIQHVIRLRSELDKIPVEWFGRFFDRLDELLGEVLNSAKADCDATEKQQMIALLRKLANEITAFGPLVRTLDAAVAELNEIENAQHVLKKNLTDDTIQLEAGIRTARKMRVLNLALRWKLCRRILEQPESFEGLVNAVADPKKTSSASGV